jgi:P27 family predicted phage terminase small subunit
VGIPGRKPNPKNAREKKGNPAEVPLPDEPFADETTPDVSCPLWLDAYGVEFWNQHVPRLATEGVFKTVDRSAFETMADCYSLFRRSQKALKRSLTFKSPNGYQQQRPEVAIAAKAKEQLRLMYAEFGMTASSRTRIAMRGAGGVGGEDWADTGLDR